MRGPLFLLASLLMLQFALISQCQASVNATSITTTIPTTTTTTIPTTTTTTIPTTTTTTIPTTTQTTIPTTTQTHTPVGTAHGGASSWSKNIATMVQALFNSSSAGAKPQLPASLLSQLPGIFNGLQTLSQLRGGQNNVSNTLAALFGTPGSSQVPSWIQALAQNNSQALQNVTDLMKVFKQQAPNSQLNTLLSHVFPDVLQGLGSLNLSSSSSPQQVLTAIINNPSTMSSLTTVAQQMMGSLSQNVSMGPLVMSALQEQFPVDPTSQCASDLQVFASSLQQGQNWALQMLDAMGKINTGVLMGMSTLFGDYDECMGISYTHDLHTIQGLFCGVAVKAPPALASRGVPMVGLHLCLPKSCSEANIYGMLQPTLESTGSTFAGSYCYNPRSPSGDNRFLGVMMVVQHIRKSFTLRHINRSLHKMVIPDGCLKAYAKFVCTSEVLKYVGLITISILVFLCIAGTVYGLYLDRCKSKREQFELQPTPSPLSHDNPSYIPDTSTANGGIVNGDVDKPTSNALSVVENGHLSNGHREPVVLSGKSSSPTSDDSGTGGKLLLSFSVLRNSQKLLNCDQVKGDISCLHGIRVLSITWVILGHAFSMLGTAQENPLVLIKLLHHWTYMVLPGAVLSVDTFFVLSGCLTALMFLRSTKRSGLSVLGVIIYYIHRYWRLTVLYGLVLAFYIGVFPYLKKGPLENMEGMDSEGSCRKYWYLNVLYVNNVVPDKMQKMCFAWSWYLSNDMQFSFIAPLILIPWALKGSAKKVGTIIGCLLAFALILVHMITSGVISARDDSNFFKNSDDYMDKIYLTPWCRVGPYAVGLLLGFILHKTQGKCKLPKLAWCLGWFLAWAGGLTLVYVLYDQLGDLMNGLHWNASQSAAYEALAKVVWGVCVSWVIFACYCGYGGPIDAILSWKVWAPLSRLTYGVYLLHLPVNYYLIGNHKRMFYMDGWTGTELFLAVTVLTFMVSFLASMLIEAPSMGLEKIVLGKVLKKKKNERPDPDSSKHKLNHSAPHRSSSSHFQESVNEPKVPISTDKTHL